MHIRISPPQALHELGARQNQEDALFPAFGQATADDRLFLVCDGMGGHDHGEVASQTVAEAIGNNIPQHMQAGLPLRDELLADAIAAAYDQLDARDNPDDRRRMGTTLTLLCLHRGGATMAHIGDSRIYHVRPSEHRILYQSRDHSLVMDLYLAGELTREEMDTYEGRNVITRAMQPHQERRFRPDIVHTTDLRPGDLFLLCSDGIVEQLTDSQLLNILCGDDSDDSLLQCLRTATAAAADNHSAYLIRILGVEAEPSDAEAPNEETTSRANFVNIVRARENRPQQPKQEENNPQSWLHRILKKIF
ncbi:MAG: serine/threonine-protein phosphatase [Bacteroidaceae bacterium]|nr:serine/threonine-protein phosphatase [Bacteroidaceae bacterium]MBR1791376.1 serine/threonine-protein phosphatase [Bacteroidaceae bacterium]